VKICALFCFGALTVLQYFWYRYLNMNQLLLQEKLLPLATLPTSAQNKLKGVVRIVDSNSRTYGLFLDRNAMDELLEDIEYSSPKFWSGIKRSRKSGRVSGEQVKKELGL